jgi:hypothetical protein
LAILIESASVFNLNLELLGEVANLVPVVISFFVWIFTLTLSDILDHLVPVKFLHKGIKLCFVGIKQGFRPICFKLYLRAELRVIDHLGANQIEKSSQVLIKFLNDFEFLHNFDKFAVNSGHFLRH